MFARKPPSWAYCSDNQPSTPSVISHGTAITAGANNADGSSVSLIAALTHDVEYLVIGASGLSASNGNGSVLLDILIDPAGGSSWSTDPVISDLMIGRTAATAATCSFPNMYHFPIWIPAGASIGARARTAHTATLTGRVSILAYGGNANPGSWWCGTYVQPIGIDAANSRGTNHTAGPNGAFSSWANLGSTLEGMCGALQFGVQGGNTDTSESNQSFWFEFGANSTRIGPSIFSMQTAAENGADNPTGPIFCQLDAGSQLQVRGTGEITPEQIDVAAYAVM